MLFLEHKRLYREPYNRSPHPGADYTIPFGRAKVVKPGQSLTVITYGALVQKALLAATQIERRDPAVSIEILDLRTLAPYDWAAIRASVEKTSRVIVAHEDCLSWGYGAEIAARIADELFDVAGRSGAPRGRAGHVGGLPSATGSGDSAADRNAGGGDVSHFGVLIRHIILSCLKTMSHAGHFSAA